LLNQYEHSNGGEYHPNVYSDQYHEYVKSKRELICRESV
jgi:hypothetical protein